MPPTLAARLSVEIGAGRFDRLAGRMLMAASGDLDLDEATVDQIVGADLEEPAGQRNAAGATVRAVAG